MILNNLLQMAKMDTRKVGRHTTSIELAQYIGEYFQFCAERDLKPGIEAMCWYLGISRKTFNDWTRGDQRKEFLEVSNKAKQCLAAFTETAFQNGIINPVAGIFLLKNWFGYVDVVKNEIEVKQDRFTNMSNEEIEDLIE